MPESERFRGSAKGFCVALVIGMWLITVAANAPGHLSYDSIMQLNEGRDLSYLGHHPPLMSLLLGIFDRLLPGTALYMTFVQSFFFASVLVFVLRGTRASWLTAAAVLLVCLSPVVLIYQGIVWKDVLFANLALFSFALLFRLGHRPPWVRYASYAGSMLAGGVSTQARQNGFVILPFIAIAIVHLETLHLRNWRAWLLKASAGIAIGIAAFLAVSFFTAGVIRATATQPPANSFGRGAVILAGYDIAGVLALSDSADVGLLRDRGLDVTVLRDQAKRYYTPERIDPFDRATEFGAELHKLSDAQLLRAWITLIIRNPGPYLHHRALVFRWMIAPPEIMKCLPLHIGVDGPTDVMTRLGLQPGQRPSDHALFVYASHFMYTPVFQHVFYLVFALVIVGALMLRGGRDADVVIWLVISSIAFALSWFVFGVACDFRYLYFLTVSVGAALIAVTTIGYGAPRADTHAAHLSAG